MRYVLGFCLICHIVAVGPWLSPPHAVIVVFMCVAAFAWFMRMAMHSASASSARRDDRLLAKESRTRIVELWGDEEEGN